MNLYYLSDNWPWFGAHQCYGRLIHYVNEIQPVRAVVDTEYGAMPRLIGKAYSICKGRSWRRDSVFAASELKFSRFLRMKNAKENIYHILFVDLHHYLLEGWDKAPANIIGTIHHPVEKNYCPLKEKNLKRLSSAIVMYSKDIGYFENIVGKGRVKFVPHGVDTDFFRPNEKTGSLEKRLLFTGINGRNTEMLKRVVIKLSAMYPELAFDLLVPKQYVAMGGLGGLRGHPRVNWLSNLAEEGLAELYQKSYLLLMPMSESGANNAIVEALACGLPVVTTDVGGVRDYGGGSVYPVVADNDDDAMVGLVGRYLKEPDWRGNVAKQSRRFAEANLAWPLIAGKHLEAYKELSGRA